jgi:hypothetical protein
MGEPLMEKAVFLEVPYHEKDEAKRLGAKWDPVAKKWCVPEGGSLEPFNRWLPKAGEGASQISAPIYVLESSSACWSCGCETPVVALAVDHLDGQSVEDEESGLMVLDSVDARAAPRKRFPDREGGLSRGRRQPSPVGAEFVDVTARG